jgi:hypothetical protein
MSEGGLGLECGGNLDEIIVRSERVSVTGHEMVRTRNWGAKGSAGDEEGGDVCWTWLVGCCKKGGTRRKGKRTGLDRYRFCGEEACRIKTKRKRETKTEKKRTADLCIH